MKLPRSSAGLLLWALACGAQTLRVEDLERMALEANPSIAQARAAVRAAGGRTRQAGLYPNPVIGATGEHVSPRIQGGALGGFVEQRVVTAGKLGLDRKIAAEEEKAVEQSAGIWRMRVRNRARTLFYRAMGAERRRSVRVELAGVAGRTAATYAELANVGIADRPDVLGAEIERDKAALALTQAGFAVDAVWRQIAALVNRASLAPRELAADFDAIPEIGFDEALAAIYRDHPELRAAEAMAARSGFALRRAEVEKVPDLQLRGGLRRNGEILEGVGPPLRRLGLEGIFDVGVELPVFNKNQGAVTAARFEWDRAKLEADRVKLELRAALAEEFRAYGESREAAVRYRETMIPKAKQALEMYTNNFRQMAVDYPRVLAAWRNLTQLQEDYVSAAESAWIHAISIQGALVD